jgi:hypothetical protein
VLSIVVRSFRISWFPFARLGRGTAGRGADVF